MTKYLFLQSEGCCDRLYVYEQFQSNVFVPGASYSGYANGGFPGTLNSTGPSMHLYWHSDYSVIYPGWKVLVTEIPA